MISINLLDSRRKEVLERQAMAAKITIISFVVVGFAVVLMGSIFFTKRYFLAKLAIAEGEVTALEQELDSYTDVYTRMAQINQQLSVIDQIINTRDFAKKKLDIFINLAGSGKLEIRNVGFGGALNPLELEVAGVVSGINEFNQLNTYMRDLAQEKDFESVTLVAMNRTLEKSFNFRYLIKFK